ncbi:hypothetical protein QZH41_016406 [Actinostola sp. cb2023]|nr:hypothetical protein QZH41_016406 [Actinostola sp. cb2023]
MRGHGLGSTDITRFYSSVSSKPEAKKKIIKQPRIKPRPSQKPVKMSWELSQRIQRQQQAPKTELDYEIERLKAELQQEKQMKEMLDESSQELEKTITEMQDKFDTVDNEGKPKHIKTYNGLSDTEVRKLMRKMERDKAALEGQLRDLEWRLDNESKAYHKINEERTKYITELHEANSVIDDTKTKRRQALNDAQKESDAQFARITNPALQKGSSVFGLPDNQRILDPKKGPVKKTAAVRKLPKISSSVQSPR